MPLLLLASLALSASAAVQPAASPVLTQLGEQAAQDPASAPRIEGAKQEGSRAFDGGFKGFTITTLKPVGYVAVPGQEVPALPDETPAPTLPRPSSGNYIFTGHTPLKGVTIYTPKDDPNGTGRTEKPQAKGPVSKKLVWGALGLGAAAAIGGLFFPPLLFLGGLLLGAGAVLWFLNKKFAK